MEASERRILNFRERMHEVVMGTKFEICSAAVIVSNAILLGIQVDHAAKNLENRFLKDFSGLSRSTP